MDIFFQDPDQIPLPPGEVRLRRIQAVPYPDARRVRVTLALAPFQKRPSLEVTILGPDGSLAAQADVIESMATNLDLTLHLRGTAPSGAYTLQVVLFYIQPPSPEKIEQPERTVVDTQAVAFDLLSNIP